MGVEFSDFVYGVPELLTIFLLAFVVIEGWDRRPTNADMRTLAVQADTRTPEMGPTHERTFVE
jgi:hypothetical protein